MRAAGLFAGIGGLEVGLRGAGIKTTLACEVASAAQAVLRHHFPGAALVADVRDLDELPSAVDVVAAGFPCQDLSQAGRTLGLAGGRSSLVSEVFRLLKRADPKWVVLENVPFMLQLSGGSAMRVIVGELERFGFRWAWRVVDTWSFGLPQRRERVFLVASRTEEPAGVLFADNNPVLRPKTDLARHAHGFYWTEGLGGLGWAVDAVPTLKNGSTIGIPSPPAILFPDGLVGKPDIRDAERLQGFDIDWTAPAEEVAKPSSRWGLVGSAVSVPVARWIGQRLVQPGTYDGLSDGRFPGTGKLPRAARFDGEFRHAVDLGTDPVGVAAPSLSRFLHFPVAPLSAKATRGFLGRAQRAKLRFADGFIDAVAGHLHRVDTTGASDEARFADRQPASLVTAS